VAGSCEHGDEPSDSIKGGEFLKHLGDYKLFKKDSVPYGWIFPDSGRQGAAGLLLSRIIWPYESIFRAFI
jgi:hypothetical protein